MAPANASSNVTDNSNHTWRISDMRTPRGRSGRIGCRPRRDGLSLETILARPSERFAPFRQARQRIAVGTDATNTLPQAFGVETEHRQQVGTLAGGPDPGLQVVQHERLGV